MEHRHVERHLERVLVDDILENLPDYHAALNRVLPHDLHLNRVELGILEEDFVGNRNLPDVMERRGIADILHEILRHDAGEHPLEVEHLRNPLRIDFRVLYVLARVSVALLDERRHSFDYARLHRYELVRLLDALRVLRLDFLLKALSLVVRDDARIQDEIDDDYDADCVQHDAFHQFPEKLRIRNDDNDVPVADIDLARKDNRPFFAEHDIEMDARFCRLLRRFDYPPDERAEVLIHVCILEDMAPDKTRVAVRYDERAFVEDEADAHIVHRNVARDFLNRLHRNVDADDARIIGKEARHGNNQRVRNRVDVRGRDDGLSAGTHRGDEPVVVLREIMLGNVFLEPVDEFSVDDSVDVQERARLRAEVRHRHRADVFFYCAIRRAVPDHKIDRVAGH